MIDAAIVGIGQSAYTRWGGITDRTEFQLACEAVINACSDAGVAPADLQGFVSFASDRNDATALARDLEATDLRFADLSWLPGGGGGCAAVAHAAYAVASGIADPVVVYRGLAQGQHGRFGAKWAGAASAGTVGFGIATTPGERAHGFDLPYGISPAVHVALLTQRYLDRYARSPEEIGHVPVSIRAHATRNPNAILQDRPLTMSDYLDSPWIATPLRRPDCCLESDGACALVVTSPQRAKDLAGEPVHILAAGEGFGPELSLGHWADSAGLSGGGRRLASRLWATAGVAPGDVDVVQIYDHFTGPVLLALEDFGFCDQGEALDLAASGALAPGGSLPCNTAGGNLAEAYVHGLNHVVEGVRQMRGTSTSQVPNAEVCLVTSASGLPSSALVLGRHR